MVAVLSWVAVAAVCYGGPDLLRGHRLVHRFDFEEAKLNNFEDLPIHWFVIGRPADTANPTFLRQPLHEALTGAQGFPRHTIVRFDHPQDQAGPHSLYLGLDGGNAGAFLEVGALPAVPGSDYLINASVRTEALEHAGARLVAYFVDANGNRIDPSESISDTVRTRGQWQVITVKLRGDFPKAAWIGMQVELIQTHDSGRSRLGRHDIVYQDVYGHANFDNITIWQLPRMVVRTQTPVNVIRHPDRPRLNMRVRDLTGHELIARVQIYDHLHRLLTQDDQAMGRGLSESWNWQPPLDRFGWYLVDMTAYEADDPAIPIARALSAFLWLGPEEPISEADVYRFSLSAESSPPEERQLIPELLDVTQIGLVTLSAWDPETTPDDLDTRQAQLDQLIQRAHASRARVALSLAPLPDRLAHELDIDRYSPISIFAHPRDQWLGYLSPVLLRQGQMVRQWQLGSLEQTEMHLTPDLPQLVRSIRGVLGDWAPRPTPVVPWRLTQSTPEEIDPGVFFTVDVPSAIRPETIGQYLTEWDRGMMDRMRVNFGVLSGTIMVHRRRIEDLALRMIYAWQAGAQQLALARPWTPSRDRPLSLVPDPLLGVFASVKHRLTGRRAIGELPLDDGLRGIVFDGPAGGMLATWNESAPRADAAMDLFLGQSPVGYDVWGNRVPVGQSQGRHHVRLNPTPVFIEGIDPQLAMLRASFKVDPAFIESTGVPHEHRITFTNSWPRTMTGKLTITHPSRWTITPREHRYSLEPHDSVTLPVVIQFPVSEVAGDKRLRAHFEFTAGERYDVNLSTALEMGLADVELDASLSLETDPVTGRVDAVVTEVITNTGQSTRSLNVFAAMPGYPRQERMIVAIEPDQAVVRRFRFPVEIDQIADAKVRVGLREISGPAVLNQVLSFE